RKSGKLHLCFNHLNLTTRIVIPSRRKQNLRGELSISSGHTMQTSEEVVSLESASIQTTHRGHDVIHSKQKVPKLREQWEDDSDASGFLISVNTYWILFSSHGNKENAA
ncbi:mCG146310, partial [Mus musculus]